ncbi:MAG: hypothetical protein ACKVZH_16315 [Blastocatellia bacterium]
MLLQLSRWLALIFAIGLGIGEAVINWGNWQYAPLWIVDYVIVAWLLVGFFQTRQRSEVTVLASGWAFTAGVFYLALFVGLSPEWLKCQPERNSTLEFLIGLMLALAVFGFVCALLSKRRT